MDQQQHDETAGCHGGIEPLQAPSRRRATLGVAAGLVAGGAIGLFAVAPTFSSAATDAGVVQDEATEPSTGGDEVSDAPAGDRVRELLQPLVEDGTIDADQADAVASYLAEQRPEGRDHRPGPRRPAFDGEVVADLIGIDATSLREQLRDGASIADVAEANGVDPQTVIDALVAEAQAHLDLAVDNGRLSADEAAEKAATLEERVTARVNGERPTRPTRPATN
jgi:polyhydroxyalkanoate synthesis regulator phasin